MTPIIVIPNDKYPVHFHVELPENLPNNEVHVQMSNDRRVCDNVECENCPIFHSASPFINVRDITCRSIAMDMLADYDPDFLDQHPEYFLQEPTMFTGKLKSDYPVYIIQSSDTEAVRSEIEDPFAHIVIQTSETPTFSIRCQYLDCKTCPYHIPDERNGCHKEFLKDLSAEFPELYL